jgi:hypothetical protein
MTDADIPVPGQPQIACYWNTQGAVVIRQEGTMPEYTRHDDQWIWVRVENLPGLIGKLHRMLQQATEAKESDE